MRMKSSAQRLAGGRQPINAVIMTHSKVPSEPVLRAAVLEYVEDMVSVSLPPRTHMLHSTSSKCNNKPFANAGKHLRVSRTWLWRQLLPTTRSSRSPQMQVNRP